MEEPATASNLPVDEIKLDRILLIPGFCEPGWFLWPLKRMLRSQAPHVDIWQDRWIARDLPCSISRLSEQLSRWNANHEVIAIVTHSFGDWVARQALAKVGGAPVVSLISLAPVISPCDFAKVLNSIGGAAISEVPVMAQSERSTEYALVNEKIRRLVVWGRCDVWVRPYEMQSMAFQTIEQVMATHLSIILYPSIGHRIAQFIQDSIKANGGSR